MLCVVEQFLDWKQCAASEQNRVAVYMLFSYTQINSKWFFSPNSTKTDRFLHQDYLPKVWFQLSIFKCSPWPQLNSNWFYFPQNLPKTDKLFTHQRFVSNWQFLTAISSHSLWLFLLVSYTKLNSNRFIPQKYPHKQQVTALGITYWRFDSHWQLWNPISGITLSWIQTGFVFSNLHPQLIGCCV